MRQHFFESHSHGHSAVHRLPAGLKVAAALALLLGNVLVPLDRWDWFATAALLLVLVAAAARLPLLFLAKRLLLFSPFVLGIACLSLFQPRGGAIFLSLLVRSMLCLLTIIVLSNTTPVSELLSVLRRLQVPALIVTTLTLMHRYVFVLLDEAQRMQRARASRRFATGRAHVWRTLATVIGLLFVRSTERAERIYAAMTARGWR
jgi:cobalt/nickel transport system permease protein